MDEPTKEECAKLEEDRLRFMDCANWKSDDLEKRYELPDGSEVVIHGSGKKYWVTVRINEIPYSDSNKSQPFESCEHAKKHAWEFYLKQLEVVVKEFPGARVDPDLP